MLRRPILLLGIILLGSTMPALGQSLSDGSIYSRFGIGQRESFVSSQSQAMGGGGFALGSFRYANLANPAGLSDQFFTRVNGGMVIDRLIASEDGVADSKLTSGQFNAVHGSFPLLTRKLGVALGFSPFTRINYRVDQSTTVVSDPETGEETPLITSYKGNGGLHKLSASAGYALNDKLSIGATAAYIFGILEDTQRTTFENINFDDANVVTSTRLGGFSPTLGIRFHDQDSFLGEKPFGFGAAVTLPTALSGDRIVSLDREATSDTLRAATSGSVDLPVQLVAGLMYRPAPDWTVVADIQYEDWTSFSSDFSLPGVNSDLNTLDNRSRFSAGVEYWPGSRQPFGSYFVRMAYRAGVYSDESYVSPDPSERIRSVGITGGLSLPTAIPGTTIDLNIDVGRRGTTSNGLVKDRYFRFGLNINFGERWFDRIPLG